ncbi:glutathione S-transferase N-terminal domain-containing protein, partial [Burkholderia mallei]|uniref:glutathione S-transferase N-terminal domain-containing protein n=2 Tax=Burkholderia mallei TaxID=13373 RepID=UPI00236137D6
MKLIGMLDSPFVRRVAISAKLLGLPFEHHSISVFRQFDAFKSFNPVVKAPTLLTDDGTMLVDSDLPPDLPPTNRASRSLVKFVFGEEDEHEEALYGTANHRVSEGSRG